MPVLPLLLEPGQLEKYLHTPDLLIVDLRSSSNYAQGHIPGAVHLDYAKLIRGTPPAMGLLPDMNRLSTVLSTIGLTPDTHVVAYDEEGGGHAGRLLWTLDVLGQRQFSLLNGGIIAWAAEGYPLERRITAPRPSRYQATFANPAALADKAYILARLGQADLILLDTRSPAEYRGTDRRAARGGHIPGAVNLNWTEAIDRERQLRFQADTLLHGLLEAVGVTPAKEVIVYCQAHHRSAHTYMVLKHLGYPRVRGYAGAWSEWGNDPSLPVE
jgi:thiosulfate/3-mercaptopyruvate sulfurtransferase